MMYAIDATVEIIEGPWRRSRQIPTFYLHSHVQGITDEIHAAQVAQNILEAGIVGNENVKHVWHITAYKWKNVDL